MKKIIYIILIATLIFLCVGFAGFNSGQVVSVRFIGLRLENEFWVFVIAALFIGVLIGYLFSTVSSVKHRIRARNLDKKLMKVEKEVSNLRNLPIQEEL